MHAQLAFKHTAVTHLIMIMIVYSSLDLYTVHCNL